MNDHVFYRNLRKNYLVVERGEGIYLYDRDGRKYIDACAGAAVVNVGHAHPKVLAAMAEQAKKISFAHLSRWTSEPLQKLAGQVAELAPGDLNKLYLVSGGSEATEAALKMARQYFLERDGKSGKYKVVSRWQSYHGSTIGALSMTGDRRRQKFTPLLLDFPHIAPAFCYHCTFGLAPESCGLRCAYELEKIIKLHGPDTIAAFIAEPVVGAACGAVAPPPGYFKIIREICDRYDILLIADEVMTGFGRTGSMFAIEQFGVVPDLLCVAKGMSSGYIPLGGVIAKESIYNVFKNGSGAFVHGHTYGGNPLAAAVAVAVTEVLLEEKLVENARETGAYMLGRLQEALGYISIVGDVRGKGLLLGVELVAEKEGRKPFPPELNVAEKATQKLIDHGVVVYPGTGTVDGVAGDHFLLAPPLVINREQVDELVERLAAGLLELEKEMSGKQNG